MLRSGDVVKILPDDAPGEVEFATVVYVGPTLVEVTGGRWFFLRDGHSLDPTLKLRIEPASEARQQLNQAEIGTWRIR
jgi:hypothetical protein